MTAKQIRKRAISIAADILHQAARVCEILDDNPAVSDRDRKRIDDELRSIARELRHQSEAD